MCVSVFEGKRRVTAAAALVTKITKCQLANLFPAMPIRRATKDRGTEMGNEGEKAAAQNKRETRPTNAI